MLYEIVSKDPEYALGLEEVILGYTVYKYQYYVGSDEYIMVSQQATVESVAKVLIVDNQKRGLILILGKHLKYPEKSFLPDLPGGIVEEGESEQFAAIREAKEECGVNLEAKKIQLAYAETAYYEKENKSVSKLLYIAHVTGSPDITLSWEHSDYEWTPIDELQSVVLRPFLKKAVEYSITNGLL